MADEAAATEADRAIVRTVTYAGLFQAARSPAELHRALMDVPLDLEELRLRFGRPFVRERVVVTEGFIHPRGRQDWVRLRCERQQRTWTLLARHRWMLGTLVRFPFVRLVALSGACAHGNATDDDVDVFLVTKRDRAWAVCLSLMLLCKALGVRRTLCLNYILDETAVALPETDLFTASEIVGMKPLAGREAYRLFVQANAWVAERFPNFFALHAGESEAVPEPTCPRWVERVLELGPAQGLERLSRVLLGARLQRKSAGRPGVVLTPHRLKLHTEDHRPRLIAAFAAALRESGFAAAGETAQ